MNMYVCMYVCMDGWMNGCVYACVCVCICMYICIYVCMCVQTVHKDMKNLSLAATEDARQIRVWLGKYCYWSR
jgi:hypothetical protein